MLELLQSNDKTYQVCSILEDNGYKAYCVGGCVRDAIMGIAPHDIDITTSARPEKIVEMFCEEGCRVIETGKKHGTVTVIYKNETFEITTMRSEGAYRDNRHPDKVDFVDDIYIDLGRRDFTVNAIAYSLTTKRLIDPFDGCVDIQSKLLRCVGDPVARFNEDSLRILRALRFSSRLGFDIDPLTSQSMIDGKELLHSLSSERVFSELCGILCGRYAGDVINEYSAVISVIIPELDFCRGFDQKSKYHCYDVLTHICKVIDNTPPKKHLRLAALFHDISKPSCFFVDDAGEGHFYGHAHESTKVAERVLEGLKCDNDTKEKVLLLVKHHDTPIPKEEVKIKKKLSKMGYDLFMDLVDLAIADCMSQADSVKYRLEGYEQIKKIALQVVENEECLTTRQLSLDGNDLLSLGVPRGKIIGEVLSYILEEVLAGRLNNEREELLKAVGSYIAKQE